MFFMKVEFSFLKKKKKKKILKCFVVILKVFAYLVWLEKPKAMGVDRIKMCDSL